MARCTLASLAFCALCAPASGALREVVQVPGWPELKGFPLSFAIKTDRTVFASGLGGTDMRTMKKVGGGVGNETAQALRNLQELLVAAGAETQDVMACSVMLADIKRDFAEMNAAYAKFFPKDPPSRVAVEVGRLAGDAAVEIKCAAALPGSDRRVVQVPGWPSMAGRVPLSMVTEAEGVVYPSGMQGLNMTTLKLVPGGAAAETTQTLANIREALVAAGSDLDLVLGCEVSLADISDFEAVTKAYVSAFPNSSGGRLGGLPARIALQVGGLAGAGSVEIRCVAASPELKPRRVSPPSRWRPTRLPFSFATEAGGMVYVSGMPGLDFVTMRPVAGGVGNETRQALSNVKELLEAAGTSMESVVECEVSLADIADFKEMNAAYAPFWPDAPPARAAVQVGKLFGSGKVEIKCAALSAKTEVAFV